MSVYIIRDRAGNKPGNTTINITKSGGWYTLKAYNGPRLAWIKNIHGKKRTEAFLKGCAPILVHRLS